MNIKIKTTTEIKKMRQAGVIARETLDYISPYVKEGVSTEKLNQLCHNYIIQQGCIPAPLNYHGFPKSICTSINNVVCHGIPSKKDVLQNGDIINIDITVIKDGYHGDTSRMFCIGQVSPDAELLVTRTKNAMMRAINIVKPGVSFTEIGNTIEKYVQKFNYGVVRDFTGHGIGSNFHEDPPILHYKNKDICLKMKAGMIFTIEPMINQSNNNKVFVDETDNWTVYTEDGALSVQWEHTVLVTSQGVEILT